MGWELPFARPMPGVFWDIDRYVKSIVRTHYKERGVLPEWFPYLGNVIRLEKVPRWQDFYFTHSQLKITLRGEMDEILQLDSSGYHIVDYKTARYTVIGMCETILKLAPDSPFPSPVIFTPMTGGLI
jgi:hypothetical protein